MTALRRHSALFAALLLVTVAAQTLDVGLCCDLPARAGAAADAEVGSTGVQTALGPAAALLPAPTANEEGHEHTAPSDCLCHLVFVPTGRLPALPVFPAALSLYVDAHEAPHSALLSPPGHVPLA